MANKKDPQHKNFSPLQVEQMEDLLIFIGDVVSDGDVYAVDTTSPMYANTDAATVRNLLAKDGSKESALKTTGMATFSLPMAG